MTGKCSLFSRQELTKGEVGDDDGDGRYGKCSVLAKRRRTEGENEDERRLSGEELVCRFDYDSMNGPKELLSLSLSAQIYFPFFSPSCPYLPSTFFFSLHLSTWSQYLSNWQLTESEIYSRPSQQLFHPTHLLIFSPLSIIIFSAY